MRLIGYRADGTRYIGSVDGEKVTPLGTATEFYRDPRAALREHSSEVYALGDLEQEPPVPETARVFCVGINYLSHADESKSVAGLDLPKFPMIFGRWESTLVTDGTPVPVPPTEKGLDWEVELAVVIGETVWGAQEDTALQHVLGYTAFNDLSARRKQIETPQFTLGKNADRSGPIGPVLVTTDELADPSGLRVQTRVNGETVQDANTSDLIHSVGKIIAYITDTVTLRPGDVIATGTPGGVGVGMTPQRFLTPGDVVEVEVEHIGVVRNPIVSRDRLDA
ncbi:MULTISPECIES: fumarylacetoacetate hydrolase family protein [Rhodococcus]|uniref:fumarylacetoacetate hydrolase family protein n=1 Tax=Rhodococcus TaxID=1827 RepID=UPI000C998A82|nr:MULTISPECIES: fumarylacetoacetate hydrolase family protein [Rhodococcus]PND51830.1 FAA hydrolase family protein [Rhodococcus sp. ENV425]WKX00288.1 fumarylacetoacetate hydrolase family protein [Rhodococcus aetherivorans]